MIGIIIPNYITQHAYWLKQYFLILTCIYTNSSINNIVLDKDVIYNTLGET